MWQLAWDNSTCTKRNMSDGRLIEQLTNELVNSEGRRLTATARAGRRLGTENPDLTHPRIVIDHKFGIRC